LSACCCDRTCLRNTLRDQSPTPGSHVHQGNSCESLSQGGYRMPIAPPKNGCLFLANSHQDTSPSYGGLPASNLIDSNSE
jgi:hypothetical protein